MKDVFNDFEAVTKTVEKGVTTLDRQLEYYRRPVLVRFPTLFALLVAFGASATFYGFERIVALYPWLHDRPWLILGVGVFVLALTGRLYKKLSS